MRPLLTLSARWSLVAITLVLAVGALGVTVGTADGGRTWAQRSMGAATLLRSVWFTSAGTGIAVGDGGTMLRTIDGGNHWDLQRLGVVGTILRTTDGGQTWLAQTSGTILDLFDVFFSDGHTGSVVGALGTVLKTVDGGGDLPPFPVVKHTRTSAGSGPVSRGH